MFCSKCGKEIDNSTNFCPFCGNQNGNSGNRYKIIIAILCLIFVVAVNFLLIQQTNKKSLTVNINSEGLDELFNGYPHFVGSQVLIKVEPKHVFSKVKQADMNAMWRKLVYALASDYGNATIEQVAKDEFLLKIPNVFDESEIKKILNTKSILEFKKLDENQQWIATDLTGKDLRKASAVKDASGQWVVALEFNNKGTKKFANLTKELIGQPMAIFLNGELQSTPRIKDVITGGYAVISGGVDGGFTFEEVNAMVNLLNAELLPLDLKIVKIK